ncbi:DNA methyltransferase [Vibrio harveyi]|uniref:DNA methyltransferase n=1 Tax=Vibrio harveyi TaxID=669 RepID=UPI00234DFE4C|nr:DNA methyltransferase [Vibrio harveyi]WCP83231.1 DNA methyltransferase [Vibrio harveyi]
MKMKSIGYAGSKQKLLTFLETGLKDFMGDEYSSINSFFDAFTGSGRVANHFKNDFEIITNDKQSFSKMINNAHLNGLYEPEHFEPLLNELNNLPESYFEEKCDGWFTKNYSTSNQNAIADDGTRKPFKTKNGKKIEMIRTRIAEMRENGEINEIEHDVLITSLLVKMSRVQNCCGHQIGYLKEWANKADVDFILDNPMIERSKIQHSKNYTGDIHNVIGDVRADVLYLDAPYGSNKHKNTVRYSSYYHLYNTVAENSRPEVKGISSQPVHTRGNTDTLEKNKRDVMMIDLIKLISQSQSNVVMLSNSSTGMLSIKDLKKVYEIAGCDIETVKVYATTHRINVMSYVAAKREIERDELFEYFLIAKNNNKKLNLSEKSIETLVADYIKNNGVDYSLTDDVIFYNKEHNKLITDAKSENNVIYFDIAKIKSKEDTKQSEKVIHNADALEMLKSMPDCSVDLLVTDPPYKVCSGGKGKHNQPKGILNNDNKHVRNGTLFKHNDIKFSDWLPEAYRVLKNGTHAYILVNAKNLNELMNEALKVGFKFHNLITWKKQNATPNRWYMQTSELILFFRKGKAKPINNCGTKNVLEVDNIIGDKVHPTEKPVELLEILIANSSNKGDVVLDPFAGSASTLIAAQNLERIPIGFEKDEDYYEIGKQRLNKQKGEIIQPKQINERKENLHTINNEEIDMSKKSKPNHSKEETTEKAIMSIIIKEIEMQSLEMNKKLFEYYKSKNKLSKYDNDYVRLVGRDLSVTYPDWVFHLMPCFTKLSVSNWLLRDNYFNEQVVNEALEELTIEEAIDDFNDYQIVTIKKEFENIMKDMTVEILKYQIDDFLEQLPFDEAA